MPRGQYDRTRFKRNPDVTQPDQDPGLAAGAARMSRLREEEAAAAEAVRLAAELAASPAASDRPAHASRVSRENRKPFGNMQQKLYWPKRAGFQRYWFNDHPGRIASALAAGYAHVKDENGRPVSRTVGTMKSGAGMVAYLMEIPEEWYNDDMQRGQEVVDRTANDIHRGRVGPLAAEPSYASAQGRGISIKASR